jgi:hypothetical protein
MQLYKSVQKQQNKDSMCARKALTAVICSSIPQFSRLRPNSTLKKWREALMHLPPFSTSLHHSPVPLSLLISKS